MWVLFLAVLQTYRVFLNKSLTYTKSLEQKKFKECMPQAQFRQIRICLYWMHAHVGMRP